MSFDWASTPPHPRFNPFLSFRGNVGSAQTAVEQKVNAFVEGLRGRVSEATFEDGRYRHAGIAFDVPAGWNYGGTTPGETPADDTAHWTDPGTGVAIYAWLRTRRCSRRRVGIARDRRRG